MNICPLAMLLLFISFWFWGYIYIIANPMPKLHIFRPIPAIPAIPGQKVTEPISPLSQLHNGPGECEPANQYRAEDVIQDFLPHRQRLQIFRSFLDSFHIFVLLVPMCLRLCAGLCLADYLGYTLHDIVKFAGGNRLIGIAVEPKVVDFSPLEKDLVARLGHFLALLDQILKVLAGSRIGVVRKPPLTGFPIVPAVLVADALDFFLLCLVLGGSDFVCLFHFVWVLGLR